MHAVVEELFAGDFVVFDGVDGDFLKRDALAGGFGGDVEGEVDDELVGVGAVEERAGDGFAVEGFIGGPVFGFLDHGSLAGGFFAAAFDGDDVGGVQGLHDVEVLPWLHNWTNWVATVLRLMWGSLKKRPVGPMCSTR